MGIYPLVFCYSLLWNMAHFRWFADMNAIASLIPVLESRAVLTMSVASSRHLDCAQLVVEFGGIQSYWACIVAGGPLKPKPPCYCLVWPNEQPRNSLKTAKFQTKLDMNSRTPKHPKALSHQFPSSSQRFHAKPMDISCPPVSHFPAHRFDGSLYLFLVAFQEPRTMVIKH